MASIEAISFIMLKLGWDGGIRTPECLDQNQVPYHLATSHWLR
jgi:hypothetical protein